MNLFAINAKPADWQDLNNNYLYARPSFLEGLARIMDFGNTLNEYNTFPRGEDSDCAALSTDWTMVGQDINRAMGQFEREDPDWLRAKNKQTK